MGHWVARATLADGTEIEKKFPYTANRIYVVENSEQYRIECWIFEEHDNVIWASVDYEEDDYDESA